MTKTTTRTLINSNQTIDYQITPHVSVILPIYNERRYILQCLAAIQNQDYPANSLEILVIDGFSTDGTRALVGQVAAADKRIKLIDNPERLQANALNHGINASTGQIIVRVDGHVLIAPDYVRQCVQLLNRMAIQNVVNVGGPMRPQGENSVGNAIAAATQSPFGIPTAFHHSDKAQYVDTVYLGAWPRALFDHIGSFNPAVNVNEDYEFNYRTRMAGGQIYLSPEIHSVYFCRSTFRALWHQYYIYGRQKVQMLRRYPGSIRIRQLIAPAFVAALIGLPILFLFTLWAGGLWLLMLAAYGGVASVAARKTPHAGASIINILIAFVVMHTAWGCGFWRGISQVLIEH